MTLVISLQNDLYPERIKGDLVQLMNDLNVAAANGKQFAILDSEDGPVMIQTRLITKARPEETDDAFVGG